MKTEYDYENRQYELAVQSLKATSFDIVYCEKENSVKLEKLIEIESNESKKQKIKELLEKQNSDLDYTIELINNLISAVEKLDSYTKSMNSIMLDSAISVELEKIDNNDLTNVDAINKKINEQNNLVESSNFSTEPSFEMKNIKLDKIVVDDEVEGKVSSADNSKEEKNLKSDTNLVVPDIPINNVDNTKDSVVNNDLVDKNSVVPEISINSSNSTNGSVINNDSVDKSPAVPDISINNVDNTKDSVVNNDLVDKSPAVPDIPINNVDNTKDSVVNNDLVDKNSVVPEISINSSNSTNGSVINNDSVDKSPAVPDISINNVDNTNESVVDSQNNLRFKRAEKKLVKAILVTKKQYSKLAASRVSQKDKLNINSTSNYSVVNFNDPLVSIEEKRRSIEKMLEQANSLYKDGKVAEAQAMYDNISTLNKQLHNQG